MIKRLEKLVEQVGWGGARGTQRPRTARPAVVPCIAQVAASTLATTLANHHPT